MAPRTIQGRTVTASFDDLLVYWPLGNDLNKYEPSHSVEISSSHPDYFNSRFKYDQNKALTTKGYYYGYNFTSQTGYSEEEERNFTLTPREIGPSPYSDKIRLEDNSLLGVLSIDNKMERSSLIDGSSSIINIFAFILSSTNRKRYCETTTNINF